MPPYGNLLDPESQKALRSQALLSFGANLLGQQPTPYPQNGFSGIGQALSGTLPMVNQQALSLMVLANEKKEEEARAAERAREESKPISVGGMLIDPKTYKPILDTRQNTELAPKVVGNSLVDPKTGKVIFQAPGGGEDPYMKVQIDNKTGLSYGLRKDTLRWEQIQGAQFSPGQSESGRPSNVQEYEYWKSLPPEEQQRYLAVKRSLLTMDLGGSIQVPDPLNPAGPPRANIPKTIPPQDQPAFMGEQAAAKSQGEAEGKRAYTMGGLGGIIDEARNILKGPVTPTHSKIGALVDVGGQIFGTAPKGAAEADQLRAIGGALVAKMPRMEGPQSNYDVQNYKEMAGQVGDPTLPIERRLAALDVVETLWRKYDKQDMGFAPQAPQSPTSGDFAPNDKAARALEILRKRGRIP